MKKSRKAVALALSVLLAMGALAGCGGSGSESGDASNSGAASQEISVVSREDGSGTRGAFVELTGVEEKDADGNKVDNTTPDAIISNSTSTVMTTVAGNEASIGYISLGSLNDTVKGVKVDDVEPTAENINNGTYKLSRPVNIVTKGEVTETSEAAQDFINFIMSKEGQTIVSEEGYISVGSDSSYTASGLTGTVTLAGSTSVAPVMDKIAEKYMELNEGVTIEIQQSGSGAGITSTIEGVCDIGMSSRELKENEIAEGVAATKIAMDGIAVIVNVDNTVEDLTSEQIKDIFVGKTTKWSEVQ